MVHCIGSAQSLLHYCMPYHIQASPTITPCRPWPSIAIMCFCLLVSIVHCIAVPLVVAYDLARLKCKMARLCHFCSLVHCECATCTQQLPLHIVPRHYTDVVTSCFGKTWQMHLALRFAPNLARTSNFALLCIHLTTHSSFPTFLTLSFCHTVPMERFIRYQWSASYGTNGIANHLTGVDHSHPLCFEGPKLAVLGVACVVRS